MKYAPVNTVMQVNTVKQLYVLVKHLIIPMYVQEMVIVLNQIFVSVIMVNLKIIQGRTGSNCDYILTCNKTLISDLNVCSGRGKCLPYENNQLDGYCECAFGYNGFFLKNLIIGTYCQYFTCSGKAINHKNVCFGRGKCISLNKCKCYFLFQGDSCENPIVIVSIIVSVFTVCIFFMSIMIVLMLIILIIIILYTKRQKKKFMTKNKELTEKLFMISDLQKINFNLIKFKKNKLGSSVVIGEGASSKVYLAKYSNTKVAIKELNSTSLDDCLITELILLKNLNHENVIKVFGYTIDFIGNIYIVSEYLNRGSLKEFMKENQLSIFDKFEIIFQIVNGIYYLHSFEKSIIHRDLKTDNILMNISNEGMTAKISDFGISKISNNLSSTLGIKFYFNLLDQRGNFKK
jgi:tRNA A-37 threonylcarbamoyl transferase component Bud32